MSNLLISEPPLQVLPSLAVKIGLNEAIILQQFHYWIQRSKNIKDGRKWIYNSIAEWNKQFPFWSESTLKRAISSLTKQGLIITANYNKAGFDKTKWYSINYDILDSLSGDDPMNQRLGQNDLTSSSKRTDGTGQNEQTNTKRLPETNTETTKEQTNNKPNVFDQYESNFRKLNSFQRDQFIDYINRFGSEIIELAIKKICLTDSLSNTWGSFDYLMKDWGSHSLYTINAITQYENDRQKDIQDRKTKYGSTKNKQGAKYEAGDDGYRKMREREDKGELPF